MCGSLDLLGDVCKCSNHLCAVSRELEEAVWKLREKKRQKEGGGDDEDEDRVKKEITTRTATTTQTHPIFTTPHTIDKHY